MQVVGGKEGIVGLQARGAAKTTVDISLANCVLYRSALKTDDHGTSNRARVLTINLCRHAVQDGKGGFDAAPVE